MCAATVSIDGGVVIRIVVNCCDFCSKFFKNGFIDGAGGTVGTVQANFKILEVCWFEII